ncbi:MAG: ABC transporter ATP-binding protein, partial [Betaproteobacteria bacterium]|nr:ABC transporter ATP-binding protein [Betaproteobacteria bacterium]
MNQATEPRAANAPLVDMQGLRVTFTGGAKPVHAVSDVSLQLHRGEVLALIGESGSGKSVTLRALLRLHSERHTLTEGRIDVSGQDVVQMSQAALSQYRGAVASMIFQEPLLALDPVYTLEQQITESIRRHEPVS